MDRQQAHDLARKINRQTDYFAAPKRNGASDEWLVDVRTEEESHLIDDRVIHLFGLLSTVVGHEDVPEDWNDSAWGPVPPVQRIPATVTDIR